MTLIVLLVLLVLFGPVAIDIYLPAIPQMAQHLGTEVNLLQGSFTWFMFSMGLGQLLAGPLADRYGRKPIALGGVLLYGLSALAASFAADLGHLILARVVQGIGASGTSVAAFSMVRDCYGKKKSGQMLGYLNGAICFIPALAPLFGAWLTSIAGWSANFWFMAGYAALVFCWLLWSMPETRPSDTRSGGPLISWSRYSPMLSSSSFVFNATLCLLAMSVILAYVTVAPVHLMSELGLSMSSFNYWFSANAALNIVASFMAPSLISRVGPRRTLRIGLLILLVSAIALTLCMHIPHPLAMMGPLFLASFGFVMILSSAAGMALAPFGHCAGTAGALLGLFQLGGSGALVSLTGALVHDPLSQQALHMWLLLPPLLVLLTRRGRRLCFE